MAKQFLDIPVEGAKDLIERVLADPSHNLTDYAGGTVSYAEEVWFNETQYGGLPQSTTEMYFGTIVVPDPNSAIQLAIYDSSGSYNVLIMSGSLATGSRFDCVIFNETIAAPTGGYFYGYKFNITY